MDLLRSLPIGFYLETPQTWLHRLDPRLKLLYLSAFFVSCILASAFWRWGLVIFLALVTLSARMPRRVWIRQFGGFLGLCMLSGLFILFLPDGVTSISQARRPLPTVELPQPTAYRRIYWQGGKWTFTVPGHAQPFTLDGAFLQVTRQSAKLATVAVPYLFMLLYGTNLLLLTTTPEDLALGLERLLRPLRRWGLPTAELGLVLALALRFFPLLLEEGQNIVRSVSVRAIDWRTLGISNTGRLVLSLGTLFVENMFTQAQRIAEAMQMRGFREVEGRLGWRTLQWGWVDQAGLAVLSLGLVLRVVLGGR